MTSPQNTQKLLIAILTIIIVFVVGYLLIAERGEWAKSADEIGNYEEARVVVKKNEEAGVMRPPAGLPADILLENENIIESFTTDFLDQDVRQLSVSYTSSKTVSAKYAEYKNYMTISGYEITESPANAPVRAIFGTKEGVSLSVAVSASNGDTLVQLSYLLASL